MCYHENVTMLFEDSGYTFWNTSLYTTLVVLLVVSPFSSVMRIFKPFLDVTLEIAMYNWP